MLGLLLIGLGTGGIKPCVSAFGGDQFSSSQVNNFYFIENQPDEMNTFKLKDACMKCGGLPLYIEDYATVTSYSRFLCTFPFVTMSLQNDLKKSRMGFKVVL